MAERISRLVPSLILYIEPNFGLLDELFGTKVLSYQEMDAVRCKRSDGVPTQNTLLLQLLSTKDDDKCQLLLNCLKSCGQPHVVTYIVANGG